MASRLKEAEYLDETIAHKTAQLMEERGKLRDEVRRLSERRLSQDKNFVEMFHRGIICGENAVNAEHRLARMLKVR